MTLKVTTYFRFDASSSELHLNLFYDQTERERNTSSIHEMKEKKEYMGLVFLDFFSFYCCQRSFLLSFFLLTIQVTNHRVGFLGEKGKKRV